MSDAWLSPDTCGVKLNQFEQLAQIFDGAAAKLERLSGEIAAALVQAEVDTAPALSIDHIASWARRVAPDLRRRAQLAQDLDKQGLATRFCSPATQGTLILLPDRFQDQVGQLKGREAGKLLSQAATGDRRALTELQALIDDATNPYFAEALLQSIGATGLIVLAAALAYQLHLDESRSSRQRHLALDEKHTNAVLQMLAAALAVGTAPTAGPAGEAFLRQLQASGRAQHHVPGAGSNDIIYGYQSLATILEIAVQTGTRFPLSFFRTIGLDMIAFDRQLPHGRDLPIPGLKSKLAANHFALGDLTQQEGLGIALNPSTNSVPYGSRTDFLIPLFNVAQSSAAAQTLLSASPPGKPSNLQYLLTDRAPVWAATDHGAALGRLMHQAMSTDDPQSASLFEETVKTLGAYIRQWLKADGSGHLAVTSNATADQLSGLRSVLADILVQRLNDIITKISGAEVSGGGVPGSAEEERNLAALIAFAASDDAAFWTLAKAQIGHTKAWLDQQLTSGRGVEVGLAQEAMALGFILALRQGMLQARQEHPDDAQNRLLKQLVDHGIGYIPVPYASLLGDVVKGDIEAFARDRYTQVGDWLADKAFPSSEVSNDSLRSMSDEQTVASILNQMLLSAAVQRLKYSPADANGKPFASGGKIRPPETWNADQLDSFTEWCREREIPVPILGGQATTTINNAKHIALNLFIDSRGTGQQ